MDTHTFTRSIGAEEQGTTAPKTKHKRQLQSAWLSHHDLGAPLVLCLLISVVGLGIAATILSINIPEQNRTQQNRFLKVADEAYLRFDASLDDYRVSGLWVHQACEDKQMTLLEYRKVYQYIISTGVEFLAVSCGINVTLSERLQYENQSRAYLGEYYPSFDYVGFNGFSFDPTSGDVGFGPIGNKSHYFVTHFVEPLEDPYNLQAVDFDITTSQYHSDVAAKAIETGQLSVTGRLNYLPPPADPSKPYQYTLIMVHPGLQLAGEDKYEEENAAVLVVRFAALLEKAYRNFTIDEAILIYVYDSTDAVVGEYGEPAFLGGATVGTDAMSLIPEVNCTDLEGSQATLRTETTLEFAARQWTFVVIASPGTYHANYFLAIFGASMILLASICAAMWIYSRSNARAEKASILLESAKRAAQSERELNDFIAHEVRNPLSAAISANKFVSLSVNEMDPLRTAEAQRSVREDVVVIGNSLQYINDLLRSMLDFHCALSNQIQIMVRPVDIRNDILSPVASMLYHRGCNFEVLVECPDDIVVISDPLRLKQVILNLAVNATKFVLQGFVRLRAEAESKRVCLYVEDSGPGISPDKRKHLFNKFQTSLDSLNQGTGIGLSLCKHLVELLKGEIRLDENYDSGVANSPGCRFVVVLNSTPQQYDSSRFLNDPSSNPSSEEGPATAPVTSDATESQDSVSDVDAVVVDVVLPDKLSVLFVDDDFILRKLFVRSTKRCQPNWTISEAASGEAALQLIMDRGSDRPFDVVFLDQYMASAEKQLLGTETVRLLRSKGVDTVVCGLSANNIESQFLEAGADAFIMKPLPCSDSELVRELGRVLGSRRRGERLV